MKSPLTIRQILLDYADDPWPIEFGLPPRRAEIEGFDGWGSSSAATCLRKQFLHRLGVPKTNPPGPAQLITFLWGDTLHALIQAIAQTHPAVEVDSVEDVLHSPALNLAGHPDNILDLGNGMEIPDYKSQHSGSFKYKDRDLSTQPEDPREAHYYQIQTFSYLYMARNSGHPDLEKGRLVLFSKDDGRMSEHPVYYRWGYANWLEEYYGEMNKMWGNARLPLCTCEHWLYSGKGKGYRQYCPYATPGVYKKGTCCLPSLDWEAAVVAANRGGG